MPPAARRLWTYAGNSVMVLFRRLTNILYMTLPEFRQISFDANELEAIRLACERQAEAADISLDESSFGRAHSMVLQEVKADDMLLIKQTVRIFKPGQKILITSDDLELMKQSLENFLDMADYALTDAIHSAIQKIENCGPQKKI